MSGDTPYSGLDPQAFWRKAVAAPAPEEVDPTDAARFRITPETKIVSAGSCFAQHIARHLRRNGFTYLITEKPHPLLTRPLAEAYHYGLFSARYGNIYTARQLRQLIERALGRFRPAENAWRNEAGQWVDPFRPQIQPDGFASLAELERDRKQHLASTRTAFEQLDLFIFTLGLTESWEARGDGAVFPLCPGVAGGEYDERRHAFRNLTLAETSIDLIAALELLKEINPGARAILTVSPVALMATASGKHVLNATSYSKAVLRVAAEEAERRFDWVQYFPSFEIITGPQARGRYFAADLRSVTEAGVEQVMRLFLARYAGLERPAPAAPPAEPEADAHLAEMERLVQANCDEEALSRFADRI